jgi:hypothetical protein
MRYAVLLVVMAGCSSGAVPAATMEAGDVCLADLTSPIAIHVEAPHNPACPDGAYACELAAWCKGFGEMAAANQAELFSVTPSGSLDLQVIADDGQNGARSVSFNMPGYVCSSPGAGASSYRYENAGRWNVSFIVPCMNTERGLFTVEGTLSGPTR